MAEAVYLLCAATSVVAAALLLRAWSENRTRLLLWSSACFVGLALNNILLFVDLIVVPAVDLTLSRNVSAAAAVIVLLYGLVWDTE
ncbi:MAG TPA: DUF5985 family protein [Vicinamibacterales bacterium]|jgi:hypothetical protein